MLNNHRDVVSPQYGLQHEADNRSKCLCLSQTRQTRETTAQFYWTEKSFQSEPHTDSVEPQIFGLNFDRF